MVAALILLCVFPTCAIVVWAPHKFSSSTTAHLNIIGGAQCTIFFQIYIWSKFWLTSWKTLGLTAGFQNWSNWFPGGTDLLGSSRTTVAVAVWKGFAKEMRPRSMFLGNCYSNLIGWSNPLQQPMMCSLTGDWIRILPESANLMLFGVLFPIS